MFKMSVITSKAIESNENVHYFAMKTIEFYAVRKGVLDIAADFGERFRPNSDIVLFSFFC